MKDITQDPAEYFGDKYNVLRVGFLVEPTLCNHSKSHPRVVSTNDQYIVPESSTLKQYEQKHACPSVSSMENAKSLNDLALNLKSRYDIYTAPFKAWNGVWVPVYSEELDPLNQTDITTYQLDGVEKALKHEHKALRLDELVIELLNPFDHVYLKLNSWVYDETTKTYIQNYMISSLTPLSENTVFVMWGIMYVVCLICFTFKVTKKLTRNICCKRNTISPPQIRYVLKC